MSSIEVSGCFSSHWLACPCVWSAGFTFPFPPSSGSLPFRSPSPLPYFRSFVAPLSLSSTPFPHSPGVVVGMVGVRHVLVAAQFGSPSPFSRGSVFPSGRFETYQYLLISPYPSENFNSFPPLFPLFFLTSRSHYLNLLNQHGLF